MTDDLHLRRKWTFRAHGQQAVFIKLANESRPHVLMKALIWALYLPHYPALRIEYPIGDRYKPDVVMLDKADRPLFWGESGEVSARKVRSLARRYRDTHLVIGKWTTHLRPHVELVQRQTSSFRRSQPFDVIGFPPDSAERFIRDDGTITIDHSHVTWQRLS
jgi:hypothetical protein